MGNSTLILIGQILGGLNVCLGFISYQMRSAKALLAFQTAVSAVFCIHYLLIGAPTGFVLNIVCLIRNLVFAFRDKKIFSSRLVPVAFAIIIAVIGLFSWEGWHSLILIVALAANTLCLSFKDAQNIRRSILVTSPLVVVYNIIVSSYGGVVYESTAIVSSAVGLIRAARNKKAESR